MKNPKLPLEPVRFYRMSHILSPKTWVRKRGFELHQANLKLLAQSLKNTCYDGASPDQAVFYTSTGVVLIGTELVTKDEVVENGIHHVAADGIGIVAIDGLRSYASGLDSWREIRVKKVGSLLIPAVV